MRSKVLFFCVLAMALTLVGCGQEDDPLTQGGGLGDAAQPSFAADAASDTGAISSDAALSDAARPDAGTGPIGRDAGTDSGQRNDASTMPGGDAGADTASDGGPRATGDAGYSPCPAAGEPCKILPLGDSITFGIGYAGAYRVELFHKANADMKKITFLGSQQNGPAMVDSVTFPKNNEGRSGWTIDQVAGLVPMPALNGMPHIVLLMAGTNDINLSSDLPNAPKRLGALIDKIIAASPQTLIVVAQITPFMSGALATVSTLNKGFVDEVAKRTSAGKHVLLVDMNTGFPSAGFSDFVHPNKEGYDWMAGVWYKAIGPLLH